jgi:CRP-like cAMP-binding protein
VRCSRARRDGRVLTLAYREAGDLVGEMCVFDGAPRDEMAEVTAGSLISELPTAKVVARGARTGGAHRLATCQSVIYG